MKTIIKSMLFTAILALMVTGCQKESDDLNVSLKSTSGFDGGYYETNWTSGNAAAECALAGGCDGGSYKIDSGVDFGVNFNEGGVTVTGINTQSFSWTSELGYPVCKIIVKAGRGAYIFDIDGAFSGTVTYPVIEGVKAKDISHITFCFGAPQIIAVKFVFTDGVNEFFGVSSGVNVFTTGWCGTWFLGVNNYPFTSPIILHRAGSLDPATYYGNIGNLTIDEFYDVTINLNPGFTLVWSSLFVGSEIALTSGLAPGDCPAYKQAPWIYRTSGDLYHFDL